MRFRLCRKVRVRRTAATISYTIGSLTKAGRGGVSFANIPGILLGDEAPVTWETLAATSGTDGHWERAIATGVTPVPKAAGVTAGLNAGPYVFPVKATFGDGKFDFIILTINIAPNVFTISERDGTVGTINGQTLNTFTTSNISNAELAGKTVELATGSAFGVLRLLLLRPASTAIIRQADYAADPSVRAKLMCLDYRGCNNLQFDDILIGGPPVGGARFYSANNSTGGATPVLTPNTNIVLNRPTIRSSASEVVGSDTNARSGANAFAFSADDANITVNDYDVEYCYNGLYVAGDRCQNITFNTGKLRYFYDNACFISGGTSSVPASVNLAGEHVWLSPNRYNSTHTDFIQIADNSEYLTVTAETLLFGQADGDDTAQPIHYGYNTDFTGKTPATLVIDSLVMATRSFYLADIRNAKDWSLKRVTAWRCDSGGSNSGGSAPGDADTGPYINISDTTIGGITYPNVLTGTNVISRAIIYTDIRGGDAASFTATDGVFQHNGTYAATPSAASTGFIADNPRAILEAIDYAGSTVDEIADAIKMALRPEDGGLYERGDGSFNGALNPDGSWATDAAY